MNINTLASRLQKMQQTGSGRWKACCPAHNDKSPSLSIRQLDDGRILLHCFGGCSVESVLSSVGMTFADLLPGHAQDHHRQKERRPFSAVDVLKIMGAEALLVYVCATDLCKGKQLSASDRERLLLATKRLHHAAEVANGY